MEIESLKNIPLDSCTISSKEYPEITLTSLNDEELSIIKNIYVGRMSELTSVNQYAYQHILLCYTEELKNFSECMERISITEMKHFEILGKILLRCNIDPKYCTFIDNNPGICNYWSAASVNYSTVLKTILEKDIELESVAIREYNRLLEITENDNLKEIVNRILEDEYVHLSFFKDTLSLL